MTWAVTSEPRIPQEADRQEPGRLEDSIGFMHGEMVWLLRGKNGVPLRGLSVNSELQHVLNPRVSVFKHLDSVYLFDPATRSCASMNDAMLDLIMKPDTEDAIRGLAEDDRQEWMVVDKQLHQMGILIAPHSTPDKDGRTKGKGAGSTTHFAIFVTSKCNLRCTYCYAEGGDSAKTIDRDTWRIAMDHFFSTQTPDVSAQDGSRRKLKLAIHGGGEPTVEFDVLKEIVDDFSRRVRAIGFEPSVGMGSNGTYGAEVHRWIIENNIGLSISFDGPSHNRQRPFRGGQPSYDVVVSNLKKLVKEGRSVSVRATVTSESVESMEQTVELAKELGVSSVHFEPITLVGRCAANTPLRPDADQFSEKFLKSFLLGLKLDIDVCYSGLRCFKNESQHFCSACDRSGCITPDGNITTCYEVIDAHDPAASEFFIGKIDPVRGSVILNEPRIHQLQQRVVENIPACRDCFLRYQCAGDCPARGFRYSQGDLYSPDPYRCQIAERINKQLIVWLADGFIESRDPKQTHVMTSGEDRSGERT